MIDPAGSSPDIWHALLERLRQESSLRQLLSADAAACLVTAAGEIVLATEALRDRAAAGWAPATVKRLQALAAGLAPSAGLRLERITFGDGPDAFSRTMATRRIKAPDGSTVLLLVDVGARAASPATPLAVGAGSRGDGDASDATSPAVVEPEPASAIVETAPPARLRVLYESDAQGRIGRLDDTLPRLLGQPVEALAGRLWSDITGALVADTAADGAGVAAALLHDRTFANRPTLWRLGSDPEGTGAWAYAAQVSGLPMRDAEKRFCGHRGFILVDTTAKLAFPIARPAQDPAGAPAAVGHSEAGGAMEAGAPTERAGITAEPVTAALTAPVAGGNIIPLRQHEPAGARESAPPDDSSRGADDAAPMSRIEAELTPRPATPPLVLSLSERNAFREIARALGARFDEGGAEDGGRHARRQADAVPQPLQAADESGQDAKQDEDGEQAPAVAAEPAAIEPGAGGPDPSSPGIAGAAATEANGGSNTDDQASFAAEPEEAQEFAEPDASDPAASDLGMSEHAQDGPAGDNVVRLVPPPRPDPFQDLIDRLPMGVLLMRGGNALFANRTLLDLLGHDSLADLNERGIDGLFAGGHPTGGVVTLRTRDGDTEAVDARLSSITFGGEPTTLIAFRRAVETVDAARVEAAKLEVARAEQQARELSAILDTATDGVLTLDGHGRLLSLNRSAEALFGYDQREVIGENFTMLLAPESHLTALDYLEGLKGGGVASLLNDGREVVGRVRQGGRIPLSMTMGRVADGAERKFSAVLRDMTAWKRAETDLVEARRVAERASDQKSEVLAKISHEIRTPLNAIIGFTEVMSEERFGPIGNDRYKEYLQDIHQSGAYLISLVNDLLDLAKIEAGRMEMSFAAVSLNELIQQTVSLMQPEAGRQRVVLRTGLHPRLPPVVADERSLRQIVLNLLSNAIKFTDPGGQVIISTKLGDRGELALSVRDTGIGMTEKELQQALEPFRQVSATRRGHGTGLGLPITKALVEANKGALAISSARNEGTLVEVTFPPQRVLAS